MQTATAPQTVTATEQQLAAAFLLKSNPRDYGEACAPYLVALLNGTV